MPNNPATRRAGAPSPVVSANKIVRTAELDTTVSAVVSVPKDNLAAPAGSTPGVDDLIPSGVILMWAGLLADIPAGWNLCDGTNGTPDLRDRFIYGWTDGIDPGTTGGALTHKHSLLAADGATAANAAITAGTPAGNLDSVSAGTPAGSIDAHTTVEVQSGTGTVVLDGPGTHAFTGSALAGHSHTFTGSALAVHTHTLSGLTARQQSEAGSIVDADTLPPFYQLAFIQKA
jgi:hypothetical protein